MKHETCTTTEKSTDQTGRLRFDSATEEPRLCLRCRRAVIATDRHCSHCGSSAPREGWTEIDREREPWLGRMLAQEWKAVRCLGVGSSARVYEARSKKYQRPLALKVVDLDLPAHRSREENLAVVDREIEMTVRLDNPHIVTAHRRIRLSDRFAGLLLDLVEGQSLRVLTENGGLLAPKRALELTRQVAVSLADAHAQGIVHRDIKPQNVLVETLPSGDDFVRVIDFGLAGPSGRIDDDSAFLGTPSFASPEQTRCESLTPATDVYSLGATLFYLLTGTPPFGPGEPEDVLAARLFEPSPTLHERSDRPLGHPWERLVASLLADDTDARLSNFGEVVSAIDAILANRDLLASTPISTTSARDLAEGSETIETAPEEDADPDDRPTLETFVAPQLFEVDVSDPQTALALNEHHVYMGDSNGAVRSVRPCGRKSTLWRTPSSDAVTALAVGDSDEIKLVGGRAGGLYCLDSLDDAAQILSTGAPVTALAVSGDGRSYAVAREQEGVRVFGRGDHSRPYAVLDTEARVAASSADGHLLATEAADGITIWSVETETPAYEIAPLAGDVLALRFVDSALLAILLVDSRPMVVDLQPG